MLVNTCMLSLKDNQVLVENDLISFPVSLRDDEQLFIVSERPAEMILMPISVATVIAIETVV